jgi:hypothetical protein
MKSIKNCRSVYHRHLVRICLLPVPMHLRHRHRGSSFFVIRLKEDR